MSQLWIWTSALSARDNILNISLHLRGGAGPPLRTREGGKNHGQPCRTPRKESFQRNGAARVSAEEPTQVRYFFQRISTFSFFPPLVAILWYKGYIKNLRSCRRPGEYQKFFHSPERQWKSTGKARPSLISYTNFPFLFFPPSFISRHI